MAELDRRESRSMVLKNKLMLAEESSDLSQKQEESSATESEKKVEKVTESC